jgi:hypothetical protein
MVAWLKAHPDGSFQIGFNERDAAALPGYVCADARSQKIPECANRAQGGKQLTSRPLND